MQRRLHKVTNASNIGILLEFEIASRIRGSKIVTTDRNTEGKKRKEIHA